MKAFFKCKRNLAIFSIFIATASIWLIYDLSRICPPDCDTTELQKMSYAGGIAMSIMEYSNHYGHTPLNGVSLLNQLKGDNPDKIIFISAGYSVNSNDEFLDKQSKPLHVIYLGNQIKITSDDGEVLFEDTLYKKGAVRLSTEQTNPPANR